MGNLKRTLISVGLLLSVLFLGYSGNVGATNNSVTLTAGNGVSEQASATSTTNQNFLLWLVLVVVIIAVVLVLIVLLLRKRKRALPQQSFTSRAVVTSGSKSCSMCGNQMKPGIRFCDVCGSEMR